MARSQSAASHLTPSPRKLLRSKGPLSPGETEVIVYAGLKNRKITPTPSSLNNFRSVSHLITDNPSLADGIAHKTLIEIPDVPALRTKLMRIAHGPDRILPTENQAGIAGSMDILDSALPDAFKVVLFLEDGKADLPAILSDWKASKINGKTSPPSITLSRE